ncbi:MAG: oligosaccharide flippase family protein [Hasllibacter sp.]
MSTGADPRDALFEVSHLAEGATGRSGRASVTILLFTALKFALNLVGIAIVARLVPPAEFGIAALALPVAAIITNPSGLGLGSAVVQREHVGHRLVSTLWWINAAAGLLAAVALALLARPVAAFYDEPRVAPVMWTLAVFAAISPLSLQYGAILRRRMQIGLLERIGTVGFALGIATGIVMALAGASYWAVIAQRMAPVAITFALLALLVPWRPSLPWRGAGWTEIRGALGFGGGLAGYNFVTQTLNNLVSVMVGRAFDAAAAGLYFRAWTFANLFPSRLVAPLSGAFMPSLARLQDDGPAFRALFVRMVTRMHVLTMPVAVGLAAGGDLVALVVLGPEWSGAGPLIAAFSVLVLQAPISRGLNWSLTAQGRTGTMLLFGLAHATVALAAIFWGLGQGVAQTAVAFMASMLLFRMPLLLWLAVRVTPLRAGDLRRAMAVDWTLAVAAAALLWGGRGLLPALPAIAELALLALAVGAIYAGRVLAAPDIRADALRLARRNRATR